MKYIARCLDLGRIETGFISLPNPRVDGKKIRVPGKDLLIKWLGQATCLRTFWLHNGGVTAKGSTGVMTIDAWGIPQAHDQP